MKEHTVKHLTEDQVIRSVVDEVQLPRHVREHLKMCPGCREKKMRLERDLAALGEAVSRFVPAPRRPVVLPEEKEKSRGWFGGRHFWAMASAVCVAVAAFFLGWNLFIRIPEKRLAGVEEGIEQDMRFLVEINDLVENPLPQVYRAIAGEGYAKVDEDFMDFVIPSEAGEEHGDLSAV